MAARRLAYGAHAEQHGCLQVPDGRPPAPGWPVVAFIHGGFWRAVYDRRLMEPLTGTVLRHGIAVWNLEYRRVGADGGVPTTLQDVAAGIDHLAAIAEEYALDTSRVALVGHSAGGHLALWAAGRRSLAPPEVGAGPVVVPRAVVAQAPVADLCAAATAGLGSGAVRDLFGVPSTAVFTPPPSTDPVQLVGHGVEVLLVHGHGDDVVPASQSEAYAAAAVRVGDPVRLVVVPGGHMQHLEPGGQAWQRALAWLLDVL